MPNHEYMDSYYVEGESSEQDILLDAERMQQIGAKLLSSSNFEKKAIVESSFNKARKAGEKLSGNNGERRNLAYLNRLDRMIEQHGSPIEQRLWEASIKSIPTVQTENITDATWRSIQEDTLNHGGGNITLTPALKEKAAEQYRNVQRQELEGFVDYLGAETCPYPTWFKVYAWNGLTSLSRSVTTNKEGQTVFQKRDKTTTKGFPKLNPAALARVYDDITNYYSLPTDAKEASAPSDESDEALERLIKTGNFNRLYSFELEQLTNKKVEVPNNPEDIDGEWMRYGTDQADELSEAAQGTPWCIVSPSVADNYLQYGNFSGVNSRSNSDTPSQACFYLFHLNNPETGLPSPNACASIRLDTNGKVAEISGTLDGSNQRLHDSLIPTVKEKALSLPGGEQKYQAFADNEEIIRLNKKLNNKEPFTNDELDFAFEKNREIEQYNPYVHDPRISNIQNIGQLIDNGVDPHALLQRIDDYETLNNLDTLIEHGADIDIDQLISDSDGDDINLHFDTLIKYDVDINNLAAILDEHCVEHLDTLIEHGANINIDRLVSHLDFMEIARNLDTLVQHGADVDINELFSFLNKYDIADNFETIIREFDKLSKHDTDININQFLSNISSDIVAEKLDVITEYGVKIDIDQLVSRLDEESILKHIEPLVRQGADINSLVSNIPAKNILYYRNKHDFYLENGLDVDNILAKAKTEDIKLAFINIDFFVKGGANVDDLIPQMDPSSIAHHLDILIENGINIDIDKLVSEQDQRGLACHKEVLVKHGADINDITSRMSRNIASFEMDNLLKLGADINVIVSRLEPRDIAPKLGDLIEKGAKMEAVLEKFESIDIANNLEAILKHSDDIYDIASRMWSNHILSNLETFMKYGADADKICEILPYNDLAEALDYFTEHNIKVNTDKIISRFDQYDTDKALESLLAAGVDANTLLPKMRTYDIAKRLDLLTEHGAKIDTNELIKRMEPRDISIHIDTLIKHGANVNDIAREIGRHMDRYTYKKLVELGARFPSPFDYF